MEFFPGPIVGIERHDGGGQLWQELAEAVPDLLLVVDRDGTILFLNRTIFHSSREVVIGTRVFDFIAGPVQHELRTALGEIFSGGAPTVREVPVTFADGVPRWLAAHTGPIVRNGRVVAATIVARDITDKHHAEHALQESEERYRTLFEHAPEPIAVFDIDAGHFSDVNRGACELFEMTRAEMLRSDPISLSPPMQPNGQPTFAAAWVRLREALEGGAPEFEWLHRTSSGTDLYCIVRLVRLPSVGRRLVRGCITDVTRQRQLEEHVRQWQKMEAVGQLAGGIAHDFSNILSAVGLSADLLAETIPHEHEMRQEVDSIRQATRRGVALTSQLQRFTRRGATTPSTLDLNAVVSDAMGWLRRLVGRHITLVEHLDPAGAPIRADRNQVEQVLLNLVVNARDAMPKGGTLTVSTERLSDWHPVHGTPCTLRGPVVRLRVQDTGTGMDDSTRGRIFEPFFSTKSHERGTGLGLSIVSGIVKQSGGCIELVTQLGAGTRFDIIYPDGDQTPADIDAPDRSEEPMIA